MTLGHDLPLATRSCRLALDSTVLLGIAMTGPHPIEWLMTRRKPRYPATTDECVAELVDAYAQRLQRAQQRPPRPPGMARKERDERVEPREEDGNG